MTKWENLPDAAIQQWLTLPETRAFAEYLAAQRRHALFEVVYELDNHRDANAKQLAAKVRIVDEILGKLTPVQPSQEQEREAPFRDPAEI